MIEQAVMSKNMLTNHRFPCITLLSLVRLDKRLQKRTCREISALFLCVCRFDVRYLATGARQRAVRGDRICLASIVTVGDGQYRNAVASGRRCASRTHELIHFPD